MKNIWKYSLKGILCLGLFSLMTVTSSELMAQEVDGKKVYVTKCMSCHQANGAGITGAFPPVDGSEWVTGDKGRLARIILNGVMGEMTVADVTYGGAMPPWNTFLSDAEVAGVLNYIRNSWSNEAEEISADEVAKVREATKDRKQPWTEEELKQLSAFGIPK